MKGSSFLKKTIFLTGSNIITGTLVFAYSIVLSRELGPKGMGLYQLVMPLYIMFLSITGGGITIAISKLAAEKKATGNLRELYRIIKVTVIFEFIWSLLITSIVITSSNFIASKFLFDSRTMLSIVAFCPALIIISVSSVYKGAYYGMQRIVEPALIDMIEKVIRMIIMLLLVGFTRNMGLEVTTAAAVLTLSLGELSSLILFLTCYKLYVRKHPCYGKCDNDFQLIFDVLKLAIPLAVNGILGTVFSTISAVLIPKRLQAAGIPYEEALGIFGKLQGMALTIAFYPTIIISALNVLLIPSISEAVTFRKSAIVNHRINIAIRTAAVTAFSSTAILAAIPLQLGQFFFKDSSVGELLKMISPGIPIIYITMVTFAILNGLGRQTTLLINSTIISVAELVLIYIFIGIPKLNINGFSISFIGTAILGLILNYIAISHSFEYTLDLFNAILLPLLCASFTYIVASTILIKLQSTPLIILLSYSIFSSVYFFFFRLSRGKEKVVSHFTLRS